MRASPELQLLTCLARVQLSEQARAQAEALLQGEKLDWERVQQLARRHRVLPLLHRHLEALDGPVPEATRAAFRQHVQQWTLRGLVRLQGLLEVLEVLEKWDIRVLPFKGPVLGKRVYGDIALRPFSDLDLWVPREDVLRTRSLLEGEGFQAFYEESEGGAALSERLEVGKSYELIRDDLLVELHWNFLHPMHGSFLEPAQVWARAATVNIGGQQVRTMTPEDRLLYLCAHGSKHFWERLSYVCDVAESLRAQGEALDWSLLLRRTRALHAERILNVGLLLATDLLGASLPAGVQERLAPEGAAAQLAQQALGRMATRRTNPGLTRDDIRFHLKLRERLRDRLPYYRQLAKLAVEPTPEDKDWVALPSSLHAAYYLVRPLRILWSKAARGAGRSEA